MFIELLGNLQRLRTPFFSLHFSQLTTKYSKLRFSEKFITEKKYGKDSANPKTLGGGENAQILAKLLTI